MNLNFNHFLKQSFHKRIFEEQFKLIETQITIVESSCNESSVRVTREVDRTKDELVKNSKRKEKQSGSQLAVKHHQPDEGLHIEDVKWWTYLASVPTVMLMMRNIFIS
jgi:hypothetical protein